MKKTITIFITLLLVGIAHAKVVKLGLVSASGYHIQKVLFLQENDYISTDSLEYICVYHRLQTALIADAKEFISESGKDNISISVIDDDYTFSQLFVKNNCSDDFQQIFSSTDALIFFGGADIPPKVYGEETFVNTCIFSNTKLWELSFLFHLLGGDQDKAFEPLLKQKPNYTILGICLGMQEMNVATGGTMYQDIPFQVYKKKSYESTMRLEADLLHRSDQRKTNNWDDDAFYLHFHNLSVIPGSYLDFGPDCRPYVASIHHQALNRIGKGFKVVATSPDKKVMESIVNSVYPNVYGIQFHPEISQIYKGQSFVDAKDKQFQLDDKTLQFHKLFWQNFSERIVKEVK